MSSAFPIPLNALRAIEIVARAGALAPAAEELGVTVGAVSQHLRRAEERLGMALFTRTPQGLRPVPELVEILPQLSAGFTALRDGLASLTGAQEGVLNVTVGSVFASRWLIWRVKKFEQQHPGLDLRLTVTGTMLDLTRPDLDCAIRFGDGAWPGVSASLIGGQAFQPVCAPEFAARHADLTDLGKVPVIIDQTSMLDWPLWLAAHGRDPGQKLAGPVLSDASLAFDAAMSGQGLLLAADMMSADAVCDGRLVRPFDSPVLGSRGYYLATARGRRETRKLKLFRDWLAGEVPDSAQGYLNQEARP
ncbi:LysR family transcriptional regulator, regulator of gene expression of beta-lactamase [Devosia crocina]|uniref:LysR family transcriptional regulator, regulator of gene expression of beta-lactamase n=1 Tax=Devosia crocina TaxID=429728 RepID=A0A1I7NW15_9HYPH|nr:LysR substrate-binding domain-containing protein [Devosia crocina]SFV38867.1 LysR family transcriptional regulator, regulator of gene expression of beta-lactamase [Devosia crocina]